MPRFAKRHLLMPLLLSFGASSPLCAAPPESPQVSQSNPTMTLMVDATESARHLIHVEMDIPAKSGSLTLVYPQWLPGEHAPNGPIANLSNVVFTSDGRALPWNRDLVDMYAFHLNVPNGAKNIHASFDLLTASDPAQAVISDTLADIVWTSLVLYPENRTADNVNVSASLKLPQGWTYATALPTAGEIKDVVSFQTAPLSLFLDSPLIAGANTKVIPLTAPNDPVPVEIDMVGDSMGDLEMPESQITAYKNLVTQANLLWGAHHYRDYHFLYTLSDFVHGEGLEHHESSQDTDKADTLSNDPKHGSDDLLAHEYTHSWNGKYRRPYDLYTVNYQKPMQDDLLWVYEGLTEYYGQVLTARSGLWTPQDFQDSVAGIAAYLDHEQGREWRTLDDTATASQNLRSNREWRSQRRAQDYYTEMVLIWMEADSIIRHQTNNQKSLDNFAKLFGGAPSTGPEVKTYTLDDIVKTLNAVTPYDWSTFLRTRIYTLSPRAPLGGIIGTGYTLVYTDTQSPLDKSEETKRGTASVFYSLGFAASKAGTVGDIVTNSPAYNSGLAPGMKIIAVNNRAYTARTLKTAVKDSPQSPDPMTLLVQNGDTFKTYTIDYHGGAKYPHLVRDTTVPDLMTSIVSPVPATQPK